MLSSQKGLYSASCEYMLYTYMQKQLNVAILIDPKPESKTAAAQGWSLEFVQIHLFVFDSFTLPN